MSNYGNVPSGPHGGSSCSSPQTRQHIAASPPRTIFTLPQWPVISKTCPLTLSRARSLRNSPNPPELRARSIEVLSGLAVRRRTLAEHCRNETVHPARIPGDHQESFNEVYRALPGRMVLDEPLESQMKPWVTMPSALSVVTSTESRMAVISGSFQRGNVASSRHPSATSAPVSNCRSPETILSGSESPVRGCKSELGCGPRNSFQRSTAEFELMGSEIVVPEPGVTDLRGLTAFPSGNNVAPRARYLHQRQVRHLIQYCHLHCEHQPRPSGSRTISTTTSPPCLRHAIYT